MKVLIVSDTHRVNENYFRAVDKEKPFDLVIHCGDAEGAEYSLMSYAETDFEVVGGNNDFFTSLPKERVLNIRGNRIFVTHGHFYQVNAGVERLAEEAAERGCSMAFFGHTHIPFMSEVNGVLLVNPGSLTYPRQFGRVPTYMVMEIDGYGKARFKQCSIVEE